MGEPAVEARGIDAIAGRVAEALGPLVEKREITFGELTIAVAADSIPNVLKSLRDDPQLQFVSFIDLCGADWPAREKRFDVVYHLLSPRKNARVRVKLMTDAETAVPSV